MLFGASDRQHITSVFEYTIVNAEEIITPKSKVMFK
jgi:hypothetical protein